MKPVGRMRRKGERFIAPPLSDPRYDEQDRQALQAAEDAVKKVFPQAAPAARTIADAAIVAFILARAQQAFQDPRIARALQREMPWDMVKLVDKTLEEEAALQSALPVVADLVAEMDPTGKRSFFEYSKDEILRIFEAVVWCWLEGTHTRPVVQEALAARGDGFNDPIPF